MPALQPISRENHAGKRWQRYTSYSFAAGDAVAQLVAQELPKAAMVMPVGFIKVDDRFVPVAVQGLQPGQNLYVAPDGRWLSQYVPAAYRGYPFTLANTPEGQQVMCIIEDSGLLSDTRGEPFFDDDGEPAQSLKDVLGFLSQVSENRKDTQRICAILQLHGLIQPWSIKRQNVAGENTIEGLYCIEETALNQLPAQAFEEVRQAGALPLIYSQLLSMQHLQKLGQLAQAHATPQTALAQTATGDLDLEFLNDSGIISFGGLR
ncbi:peptidase [Pollutimonas nitritireducens]|uniref:Peptidase n=1 Tax=Pollutimonas nitritireducens TaxID=2045209 RepID=A0A2N4UKE2_9BURK|nr:SapC family protein [Pollutimonas nitritireducens]PLC55493.1 peptidase [Pollutimonas nitritireducens]